MEEHLARGYVAVRQDERAVLDRERERGLAGGGIGHPLGAMLGVGAGVEALAVAPLGAVDQSGAARTVER